MKRPDNNCGSGTPINRDKFTHDEYSTWIVSKLHLIDVHYTKILLVFLGLLLIPCMLRAQGKADNFTPAEQEVVAVIKQMFDAMRKGDSTALRRTFDASVRFQTTYVNRKTGKPQLQTEANADGFAKAVGTPHAEVWDERIKSYEIRIDGTLATVWTPYEFYAGKEFSHCGINAFTLYKSEAGWLITHIIDTRRREGCP
jgi:hypothetical protein